ncbi:MAG: hypothetical protein ACM31D_04750 [Bacteroidota bacterium]
MDDLYLTPAELAEQFSSYTGARWMVDANETFHDDIVCQTRVGGRVTVRRYAKAVGRDVPWGVFTTAGKVRDEYRGSFGASEEAVDFAKGLFTWHSPAELVDQEGEVWISMAADMCRRPDWSEVVYFTEGETFGLARPLLGPLGWSVGQWLGDKISHRFPLRTALMNVFLRFVGGADCSCAYGAPCSGLIHQGDPCYGDSNEDEREKCAECGKLLYPFQVSYRYAGGDPVLCREHHPTPEEIAHGRRECAVAAKEIHGRVEDCEHFETCGCVPEFLNTMTTASADAQGGAQ